MRHSETNRHVAKSEKTRSRILSVAQEHFAQFGFAGARVEAIAEAAGVRRSNLFYYFTDKSDLYENALHELFEPLIERMLEIFEGPPDETMIEVAVLEFFRVLWENPALARIILREVADASPDELPRILTHAKPLGVRVQALLEPLEQADVDPVRLFVMVTATSVFFIAAIPYLAASEAEQAAEVERSAAEVARMVRRQLAIQNPVVTEPS